MKPFSNLELSSFCGQIALILRSGISSMEGLTIMLEDADSAEEKKILTALLENMQETGSLYQAMETTEIYPPYMLNMVRIGEETALWMRSWPLCRITMKEKILSAKISAAP